MAKRALELEGHSEESGGAYPPLRPIRPVGKLADHRPCMLPLCALVKIGAVRALKNGRGGGGREGTAAAHQKQEGEPEQPPPPLPGGLPTATPAKRPRQDDR